MLNKNIIIEIIKKIISITKDKNYENSIIKVINEIPNITPQSDNEVYNETTLFIKLFENFKFYEVNIVIFDIIEALNNIKIKSTNKKTKGICTTIIGYLCDLLTKMEKIITIEIDAHINYLLRILYTNKNVKDEIIMKSFDSYIINIKRLSGLVIADEINYEQMSFLPEKENKEDIWDKISYTNYNRKSRLDKNNINIIKKYFTEEEINSIRNKIINAINSKNGDKIALTYLSDYINNAFDYYLYHATKNKEQKSYPLLELLHN